MNRLMNILYLPGYSIRLWNNVGLKVHWQLIVAKPSLGRRGTYGLRQRTGSAPNNQTNTFSLHWIFVNTKSITICSKMLVRIYLYLSEIYSMIVEYSYARSRSLNCIVSEMCN